MKKLLSMLLTLALIVCASSFALAENDKIVLSEPSDAIVRGGTLVVAKSKNLDQGMNITKMSDCSSDFTVMAAIFEGLLTIDENGKPAPGLADEWAIAEDGLSITLKLREDVSFSNGEKFNAAAVAKCLNYYVSEECGHVFKGSDLALVTGAEALDEYTVKVNLSAVDTAIDLELAGSSGFIIAPANVDNGDIATNPIGTGPYMLEEYLEGQSVTLKANPNYYRMGQDGKPLPYLDGIKYIIITDDTTKTTNLQTGDVDGVDRHASYTSVTTAQGMDNMVTYQSPVTQVYNISCNLLYEPLQDIRVRQAISYAVNAQEIVDVSMEGYGRVCPFWTDAGKWFHYDYNPYTYNPEKAKELLKEAGYDNNLTLDIALIAREPDNTVAQLLQSQLEEVGITLTINAMDSASWIAYVRNEHKEQLSIGLTGNAGYAPSKGWTIPLKAFGDVGTGVEMVDHLMDTVKAEKTTVDPEARYELIKEFQTTILDNALATVIGEKFQYGSFNGDVHGVRFNYYGWLEFANVWKAR